jgi:lipoprotein-anchoring transpeptidase ErfK/SrfK
MKIFAVVAAIAAAVTAVSPAYAFHPSDETYGYVMPKKFKRGRQAEEAPVQDTADFFQAAKPKKKKSAAGEGSSAGLEALAKKGKKGPAEMSGGARPSIGGTKPATVAFPNGYGSGTIVIDTAGRKLYYVLSSSSAYRYPIAVGKQGFAWTGTQKISRKVTWPDWRPPAEMLVRKPYLPQYMTGGVRNPLGARALYLGSSLYRIHGTNDVSSIGTAASSGCIRMTNGHVVHLAGIANIGTTVRVLKRLTGKLAVASKANVDG